MMQEVIEKTRQGFSSCKNTLVSECLNFLIIVVFFMYRIKYKYVINNNVFN